MEVSVAKSKESPATLPPVQPAVKLLPAAPGSAPVVANFVTIETSGNMAFLSFGLVEPRDLARLNQTDHSRGLQSFQGTLAIRVVLPLDVLALMHQQTHELMQSLQKQFGSMLTNLSKAMADAKKDPDDTKSAE